MFHHKAVKHSFRFAAVLVILLLLLTMLPTTQATSGITLSIPSLNIQTSIVTVHLAVFPEGVTWDVRRLRSNVGLLEGTSNFGQAGNAVLAGHSELAHRRAGVFHNL